MAQTFYNDPTSASGTNWSNPTNVYSSNDARATYANTLQNPLYITGFEFDIPPNATITGIEVHCEGQGASSTAANRSIQIGATKNGSSVAGSYLTAQNFAQNTDSWLTFGDSTNLFSTTWTPAEINASTFGVVARVGNRNNSSRAIDHVYVSIYYTVPKAGVVKDNFNDNNIDTSKWFAPLSGTEYEEDCVMKYKLIADTTNGSSGGIGYYGDILSSEIFVEIKQVSIGNVATSNYFTLWTDFGYFEIWFDGTDIIADYQVYSPSSNTVLQSATYSSTNHKWWRIRESGGTVYFDTSANGISWTNFTSIATATLVDAIGTIDACVIGCLAYVESSTTPANMIFDNFNCPPRYLTSSGVGI